jgi:hypothetical protein
MVWVYIIVHTTRMLGLFANHLFVSSMEVFHMRDVLSSTIMVFGATSATKGGGWMKLT